MPIHPSTEPRRVRPPYDVHDGTFDGIRDTEVWRQAIRIDRLAAFVEPVTDLGVTPLEEQILRGLAEREVHVVGMLANLLWRAREAAPVGGAP